MTINYQYQVFVGGIFGDLIRVDNASTPLAAIRAWVKGQKDAPTCVYILMDDVAAAQRFLDWCGANRAKVRSEWAKQNAYFGWYLDEMLDRSLSRPIPAPDDPRDLVQIEPFCTG